MTGPPHPGAPLFLRWAMACAVLVLAALHAQAGLITGRVIKVADGDTIVVVDGAKVQHLIRLGSIDAPEHSQPFGRRAGESLAEMVAGRMVRVQVRAADRFGRSVGVVFLGDVDVNRAQIERGMAWWYRSYALEQSSRDRAGYRRAEQIARARRHGLWSDPRPIPPWTWRHRIDPRARSPGRALLGRTD